MLDQLEVVYLIEILTFVYGVQLPLSPLLLSTLMIKAGDFDEDVYRKPENG